MRRIDRRAFLRRSAATTGGLSVAAPLLALASCTDEPARRVGDGGRERKRPPRDLVESGELRLPEGFRYTVLSRLGDPMSDGSETPSRFDGMAAFAAPGGSTILMRNHENKGESAELPVVVPENNLYDRDEAMIGGVTKLLVSPDRRIEQSYAVLGGSLWNCAGGQMPWGSWITCEEAFDDGDEPHGYVFEVDAGAAGPVTAVPIRSAGRFQHEAVAWHYGALYLTEDQGDGALYRLVPEAAPQRPGDLAATPGRLEALRIVGQEFSAVKTNRDWPLSERFEVEWVPIDAPEPDSDEVSEEAHDKGAAVFDRCEGIWVGGGRVYFNCTEAGDESDGQVWELDPGAGTVGLIYESPGADALHHPDNIVVGPSGELFLCEDNDDANHVRRLTVEGDIEPFIEAVAYEKSEFCGVCFDPGGDVMYVNQQGEPEDDDLPAVTYAVWGPWDSL